MIFKSKQVLTATLIIALGAALAVNWYYRNTAELSDDTTMQDVVEISGNLGDSLYVAGTTAVVTDNEAAKDENKTDSDMYFADAKLKRTQSHDKITDEINKLSQNENLDKEAQNKVLTLLTDYKDVLKSETDCENLISAKTSKECIVIINNGECQVILEKNTLDDLVILQISEIIEKNAKISSENLTIIELK